MNLVDFAWWYYYISVAVGGFGFLSAVALTLYSVACAIAEVLQRNR